MFVACDTHIHIRPCNKFIVSLDTGIAFKIYFSGLQMRSLKGKQIQSNLENPLNGNGSGQVQLRKSQGTNFVLPISLAAITTFLGEDKD
jgi:hypothetical protein